MPDALPTSASPWMAGAESAPNATAPMVTPAPAPEINGNATAGLSGAAPSVGGSAMEGPAQPHVSVARHILDALGGSNPNDKMGWAKSIIAGSLAGAANVGTAPPGGGFLTGMARGAAGAEEFQRQKTQDQQKVKQQQFENHQKELQGLREDQKTKYETAYYTQLTAASVDKAQREGGEFAQKQQELASNYWDTVAQTIGADKVAKLRAGAITDAGQLDSNHASQIGEGTHTPIGNGEAHVSGQNDKAGAVFMPNEYDNLKLKEPATGVISGYHADDKGKIVEDHIDLAAGVSLGDVRRMHFAALKQLNELTDRQKQAAELSEKQSKAKVEGVTAEHAEETAKLGQEKTRAGIEKERADTAKTAEEAKQLKEGPSGAGKLLAAGDLTLADLKSRGMTPQYIVKATEEAKALTGGKYNPSDEIVGEQALKQTGNQTFYGSANSLIDKGGTLEQLQKAYAKLPNGKLPAINKVADWSAAATGSGATAAFAQTALGVADDYAKVMGGGQGSDSAREEMLKSFSMAHSPEQMKDSLDAARAAIKSQVSARIGQNRYLKQRVGYNLEEHEATHEHVPGGKADGLTEGQTGTGSDGKKYIVKGGVWQPQQ